MPDAGSVGGLLWNVGSMTLKAIVDTLEGVDESDHKHYTEKDGKFIAQIEPVNGMALEDVTDLKQTMATERKWRRAAASHLKSYGKYDEDSGEFTPDFSRGDYDKLKTQSTKLKDAKPDEKVAAEWEAKLAQVEEKHAAILSERDVVSGHLNAQLEKHLITAAATAALAKHKGDVGLLLPHVKTMTRIEKNGDGDFVVKIVGPDGASLITKGSGTEDMGIDEAVGTILKEQYPRAFDGSGATGGGATGSSAGSKSSGIDLKLTAQERLKQYHEQNG